MIGQLKARLLASDASEAAVRADADATAGKAAELQRQLQTAQVEQRELKSKVAAMTAKHAEMLAKYRQCASVPVNFCPYFQFASCP